jgi:hypothetical protein
MHHPGWPPMTLTLGVKPTINAAMESGINGGVDRYSADGRIAAILSRNRSRGGVGQ